jgi:hypothetical protein
MAFPLSAHAAVISHEAALKPSKTIPMFAAVRANSADSLPTAHISGDDSYQVMCSGECCRGGVT